MAEKGPLVALAHGDEALGPEAPRSHLGDRLVGRERGGGIDADGLGHFVPHPGRGVDIVAEESPRPAYVEVEMATPGVLEEGRIAGADLFDALVDLEVEPSRGRDEGKARNEAFRLLDAHARLEAFLQGPSRDIEDARPGGLGQSHGEGPIPQLRIAKLLH